MDCGGVTQIDIIRTSVRVDIVMPCSGLRLVDHLSDREVQAHSHCVGVAYSEQTHNSEDVALWDDAA